MKTNIIYKEPCLETLSKMPDKFLDSVITSPPYWQLRDYGYPEQWGLEPTFDEYLNHLWQMMDLIWLKLKDTGTVWINLGDSYSANRWSNKPSGTGISGKYADVLTTKKINIADKCLLLLPHRFAIGCIDRGWIVRNDIIWAKRNGMPESVTDRFSKKHEYFFFMVKRQKYYFDLEAVREKPVTGLDSVDKTLPHYARVLGGYKKNLSDMRNNPSGKNPGSVSDFWDIPTKPNSASHYATYNDELLRKPVLAGSPEFVCVKCGKARERIVEVVEKGNAVDMSKRSLAMGHTANGPTSRGNIVANKNITTGFTTCNCNSEFQGGIIYDPFIGSGSTAEVALRANRQFIGSEMSDEYIKIAEERLKPFLMQEKLF